MNDTKIRMELGHYLKVNEVVSLITSPNKNGGIGCAIVEVIDELDHFNSDAKKTKSWPLEDKEIMFLENLLKAQG